MNMNRAYQQLESRYALIGKLAGAGSLLFWDRNVVMRPGSAAAHGEISAALTAVATEKQVDPCVADWLADAEAHSRWSEFPDSAVGPPYRDGNPTSAVLPD
jgi:Zn-dependent M32 family carboxypeptidase